MKTRALNTMRADSGLRCIIKHTPHVYARAKSVPIWSIIEHGTTELQLASLYWTFDTQGALKTCAREAAKRRSGHVRSDATA